MEWLNALWSFVGTGTALTLGWVALKKLSSWFVEHRLKAALQEHQHGLDAKLARLEADLGRVTDVVSRRNEREFQVVETAWDLMIRAVGDAQQKYGSMHYGPPDFTRLSQADAERAIEDSRFTPLEKKALLEADPDRRVELFRKYMFIYGAREARAAWGVFKNHLSTRQIFISPSIHAQFVEVQNELSAILATADAYAETGRELPTQERIAMNRSLYGSINQHIDALGASIRKRFGFEDAGVSADK